MSRRLLSAAEILRRLGEKYSSATAYRDRGRVIFRSRGENRAQVDIAEFRTLFIRSHGFRFEYRELSPGSRRRDRSRDRVFGFRVERGYVVAVDGFESSARSLAHVVAGATGITFGAAHRALKLLLPDEIPGRALSDAPAAELVRTDNVERKVDFAIKLNGWCDDEIVVDEASMLKRVRSLPIDPRGASRTGIGEERCFRVVLYEPELFTAEAPNLSLDW